MVIIFKEIVILAPLRQLPDGNQRERKQKKLPAFCVQLLFFIWCGRWDLNPHGFTHTPLKRARLPISPLPHVY